MHQNMQLSFPFKRTRRGSITAIHLLITEARKWVTFANHSPALPRGDILSKYIRTQTSSL